MRTFESFPPDTICVICKTNTNKECTLITIDGTAEGNIAEATPVHVDCLKRDGYRYNPEHKIIYKFLG